MKVKSFAGLKVNHGFLFVTKQHVNVHIQYELIKIKLPKYPFVGFVS